MYPQAHDDGGVDRLPGRHGATDRIHTDYGSIGGAYGRTRVPDPRIASWIRWGLGDARTVVNIGAGLGAYEFADLEVTAVEPAAAMIAARPPGAAPCILAAAESLPFPDAAFDAAMGILTVHHWSDATAGLSELRRVARRRVVLFTWDPAVDDQLWLTTEYLEAIRERDRAIFPAIPSILAGLWPHRGAAVDRVPIPGDCTDGFLGAWWRRPEAYLDPAISNGISSFRELGPQVIGPGLQRLAADLESGEWERRFGSLLDLDELDLAYRLVTVYLEP